jgi:hypothetical protein
MARLLFPSVRTAPGHATAVTVYNDAACTTPANILDVTNRVIPGAKVDVSPDGRLPLFYGPDAVSVLYARAPYGVVTTLHPETVGAAPTISGAKGGNAALTSLIGALSAAGVVTDATS